MESDPQFPKNPVPWITKVLIVVAIILLLLFSTLIVLRAELFPLISTLLISNQVSDLQPATETTINQEILPNPPTPTFPPDSAWLKAISMTTIYTGPGEDYPKIGILEGGENAQIIGRDLASDWWAIKVPYVESGRGWVADIQVEARNTEGVTELTDLELTTAEPADLDENTAVVTAIANTNIRSGPGLEFIKIGLLELGQEAEILGRDPESFWWMIGVPQVHGGKGWVSKDYVIARNERDVPVIGSSAVQSGSIPTPMQGSPALVSSIVLNIRSGPGLEYAIIGKLPPDQTAEIIGISPDGQWWAIKIFGVSEGRGWVSAQYVAVENAEGVPVLR